MKKFQVIVFGLIFAGASQADESQFCYSGTELVACEADVISQSVDVANDATLELEYCYSGNELVACTNK